MFGGGGGLFGAAQQQQPTSGLFGQTVQPQQTQSTGLFGGGGLFGQAQQQPAQTGGGLFGNAGQTGSSGFLGQTQQSTGLFPTTTQTSPFQQQTQGSPFGGSAFGTFGTTQATQGLGTAPPTGTQGLLYKDKVDSALGGRLQSILSIPGVNDKKKTLMHMRYEDYMNPSATAGAAQQSAFGSSPTQGLFGGAGNTLAGNTMAGNTMFGSQTPPRPAGGGLFGSAPSTSGGLFGQTQTTPATNNSGFGLFGQQQTPATSTGGLFGQTQQQPQTSGGGLFGSTTTQPSGGLFGSTQPAAGGLFGQTQPTSAFGQTTTFGGSAAGTLGQTNTATGGGLFGGNTFGSTATAPAATGGVFGASQPSTGLFGSTAAQPAATTGGGLFGASTTPAATGGLFGASATQPAAATGGLFGQRPTGTGLFGPGAQPGAATGGGLFGASTTTPQTGGGLFGASTTPATGTTGLLAATQPGGAFGASTGGGMFGSQPQTGGLFGASAAQPASTGLFGATTQPSAATGGGLFGSAPAASGGGLFGASGTTGGTGLFGAPAQSTPAAAAQVTKTAVSEDAYQMSKLAISNAASLIYGTPVPALTSWKGNQPTRTVTPFKPQPRKTYLDTLSAAEEEKSSARASMSAARPSFTSETSRGLTPLRRPTTPRQQSPILGSARRGSTTEAVKFQAIPTSEGVEITSADGVTPWIPNPFKSTRYLRASESPLPSARGSGALDTTRGLDTSRALESSRRSPAASVALVPKSTRPDYITKPSIEAMRHYSEAELSEIEDFTVEREGHGSIAWPGFTDVRGLDIDTAIEIADAAVEVYGDKWLQAHRRMQGADPDDESVDVKVPPCGTALNKPAIVTLCNAKAPKSYIDRFDTVDLAREAHANLLRNYAKEIGATFLSLSEDWVWRFRVEHFSRYAMPRTEKVSVISKQSKPKAGANGHKRAGTVTAQTVNGANLQIKPKGKIMSVQKKRHPTMSISSLWKAFFSQKTLPFKTPSAILYDEEDEGSERRGQIKTRTGQETEEWVYEWMRVIENAHDISTNINRHTANALPETVDAHDQTLNANMQAKDTQARDGFTFHTETLLRALLATSAQTDHSDWYYLLAAIVDKHSDAVVEYEHSGADARYSLRADRSHREGEKRRHTEGPGTRALRPTYLEQDGKDDSMSPDTTMDDRTKVLCVSALEGLMQWLKYYCKKSVKIPSPTMSPSGQPVSPLVIPASRSPSVQPVSPLMRATAPPTVSSGSGQEEVVSLVLTGRSKEAAERLMKEEPRLSLMVAAQGVNCHSHDEYLTQLGAWQNECEELGLKVDPSFLNCMRLFAGVPWRWQSGSYELCLAASLMHILNASQIDLCTDTAPALIRHALKYTDIISPQRQNHQPNFTQLILKYLLGELQLKDTEPLPLPLVITLAILKGEFQQDVEIDGWLRSKIERDVIGTLKQNSVTYFYELPWRLAITTNIQQKASIIDGFIEDHYEALTSSLFAYHAERSDPAIEYLHLHIPLGYLCEQLALINEEKTSVVKAVSILIWGVSLLGIDDKDKDMVRGHGDTAVRDGDTAVRDGDTAVRDGDMVQRDGDMGGTSRQVPTKSGKDLVKLAMKILDRSSALKNVMGDLVTVILPPTSRPNAHTKRVNAHTKGVNAHTKSVNAHTSTVHAHSLSVEGVVGLLDKYIRGCIDGLQCEDLVQLLELVESYKFLAQDLQIFWDMKTSLSSRVTFFHVIQILLNLALLEDTNRANAHNSSVNAHNSGVNAHTSGVNAQRGRPSWLAMKYSHLSRADLLERLEIFLSLTHHTADPLALEFIRTITHLTSKQQAI